jgi:hypothetical protein
MEFTEIEEVLLGGGALGKLGSFPLSDGTAAAS